ncbi:hypothetical protein QJ854_gp694 [Moumouvirus goulette]|uniref:Uncharacterized protein n=1 Tax=Moumouvirus goulette TaxID=1247379 RepID=M1PGG5_9VIRU|nr:hypothetical protein QJ854_gp694 [Moumouvirus goulette]AGF85088.1 hypothetical protein glt_00279 [Moumouvirus goulette]
MSVKNDILLYHIASTFNSVVKIDICSESKKIIKNGKNEEDLSIKDKVYYHSYSLKIVEKLVEYITDNLSYKLKSFEINTQNDHEIVHDFRIVCSKNHIIHICMNHKNLSVKDIIPEKLMKICKYQKNTKVHKAYAQEYQEISKKCYKKIKNYEKYSEISEKIKNKEIIKPFSDLVFETLSKKRKCAQNLYNHLFNDGNRIILKLYKNRFRIYDLDKDLEEIKSFGMKISEDNDITINFNNGTTFNLKLRTNSSEIKERLSLKFRTTFVNLDELFSICDTNVST